MYSQVMSVFTMPTVAGKHLGQFSKLLEDMISTIQVGEETPFSAQLWAPLTLPSSLEPLDKATSAPCIAWEKHPQTQRRDLTIQRARRFLGEETSHHSCALGLPHPSSF